MVYGDNPPSISDLKHPHYVLNQENWEKWRLSWLGGSRFKKRYLKKYSRREDDIDFAARAAISYVPAFAKAGIAEVKNSIFQRITDVTREGGSKAYTEAVAGIDGGVDLLGSTMNAFIGRDVLPELLTMARVGIYIDMPEMPPQASLAERGNKRPYLYWYKAEDIRSWSMNDYRTGDPTEFRALLLRDSTYDIDAHWVLPYETTNRYRYMWIGEDGYVHVRFYSQQGDPFEEEGELILTIKKIPFVLLELSDSLMSDIADYQIALLNLASSDMNYAIKGNYPFYTEQFDPRAMSAHLKPAGGAPGQQQTQQTILDPLTSSFMVNQEKVQDIRVGVAQGRRYPFGMERPGFIHPSSEPLIASMQKQDQLKLEIRQLIHLAISALTPRLASAESKNLDNRGLEAGLSYIGLELEHAERRISEYWSLYESEKPATIRYPETYSLLSDEDRRQQADWLKEIIPTIPSLTYQREIAKRIVEITLGTKISTQVLASIKKEIDNSPVIHGDPKVIEMDVESGLVSLQTASEARGYPPGEVEKAKKDHEERLSRIAKSQTQGLAVTAQARGVPSLGSNPKAGKEEKSQSRDITTKDNTKKPVRGTGK